MEKNKEFLKLLVENGLKQKELAKELGVTTQTIHFWIIGRNKPSLEHVLKMSKLMDMSIDEICDIFWKKGEQR